MNDDNVKRYLALYEYLNFKGAYNQNWNIIREIYDENVTIRMANNPGFKGIDVQIKMMKEMYHMAPDTKIISHNVQFGSGDWTAVEQTMTGTFTGEMKTESGKTYLPTGRKFEMKACSLTYWKNDKIIEETLFWDSGHFTKQIGINSCVNLTKPVQYDLCTKLNFVT